MKAAHAITAFRAFLAHDRARGIEILRMIEAAESRAGRNNVATELHWMLQSAGQMVKLPNAPQSLETRDGGVDLAAVEMQDETRRAVSQLVAEWTHRSRLLEHGLAPTAGILLYGPSGNGKTMLAAAIAAAIGMPLCVARYGELINSHVGQTGQRIEKVFTFAANTPCILLFDEADSILAARANSSESSGRLESNRAVNAMLVGMDTVRGTSLVILATNRNMDLDKALDRRVSLQIEMPTPSKEERMRFVSGLYERWPAAVAYDEMDVGKRMSYAECEEHVMQAARRAVLDEIKE